MKHHALKRMIKESGGGQSRHPEKWDIWEFNNDAVERFAKLAYESAFHDANIAALATIIDAAVLAEREACAKVCESAPEPDGADLAARIRARGAE